MGKVIVIDEILQAAYGVAFSKMEEMKYLQAEKIFDYVKRYNYIPDLEMMDYAYVIIYSNTHRIEKALEVCDRLLDRKMYNKELEMIVRDVQKQLKTDMTAYTVEDKQAKVNTLHASNEEIILFLNKIKPSNKRIHDFLDLFALNEQEESFYLKYYTAELADSEKSKLIDSEMSQELKDMISKYISKANNFSRVLKSENKNAFDTAMTLLLNMKDDLLLYYYMHKLGLIKKIIGNKDIALPIKNFMLYQMYILFINKMITNIKLDLLLINNKNIKTTIKDMSEYYEVESLEPLNDYVQLVYSNLEFDELFIENMELKIEMINANSFPMFFPNEKRKLEFFVALLYFISIYEYKNQFNDIINKVYKIDIADVKDEMDILKMLLLFINNEENYENRN